MNIFHKTFVNGVFVCVIIVLGIGVAISKHILRIKFLYIAHFKIVIKPMILQEKFLHLTVIFSFNITPFDIRQTYLSDIFIIMARIRFYLCICHDTLSVYHEIVFILLFIYDF